MIEHVASAKRQSANAAIDAHTLDLVEGVNISCKVNDENSGM
jgi:hypothetical protein